MNKLQEDIKTGEFSRFYLLYGEEGYTINNLKNKLKKTLNLDDGDMNYFVYQGKDFDVNECLNNAMAMPFFSDYRLIILENTELFKSANDFSEMIQDIPDSTIMLFIEKKNDPNEKKQPIDKRNKMYKFISKNGNIIECGKPSKHDIEVFLGLQLRAANKTMKKDTAAFFLEQIDTSFFNMKNEIDKLVNYSGEREEITKEDVMEITSKTLVNHMFSMIDEIADKNEIKVMLMYRELIDLKINVNVILFNLRTHFKHLLEVKLSRGTDRSTVISKTKMQPFLYNRYMAQAKKFTADELKEKLTKCVQMEYEFKTGLISDDLGLEILIIELLQ